MKTTRHNPVEWSGQHGSVRSLRRTGTRLLAVGVFAAVLSAAANDTDTDTETGNGTGGEWAIPVPHTELPFPETHGAHPHFKIEWWYLTGHLFSGDRRFGVQATFFRLGQRPVPVERGDLYGDSQLYMAHMALTDVQGGAFHHEERLNRGGWDAFARTGDLDVRNGNWSLRRDAETGMLHLQGSIRSEVSYSLTLEPEQDHVIFGEAGVSKKGADGTAASYYVTFPRLLAEGEVSIGGETLPVTGQLWMDHEISSSQLERNQVGWDWVSMQFLDGRGLMAFILRTEDGSVSEFSKLVWVDADGTLHHRTTEEFAWEFAGHWESPKTGATYPIAPTIRTIDPASGEERELRVRPVMEAQELTGGLGGISYWEGACDVVGEGGELIGRAYLELTGYTEGLQDRLGVDAR